jgi:hypothetical protein
MRHAKPHPIRNKIDLADPSQIRILRRRLGASRMWSILTTHFFE